MTGKLTAKASAGKIPRVHLSKKGEPAAAAAGSPLIISSKKLFYSFKNSSTMATNTAEPSQSTSSSTSNFGLWWETSVLLAGFEELKNMNAPGSFSR